MCIILLVKLFNYNTLYYNMECVSILIPIYNTNSEYFSDCLNSIMNQTTKFNIQLVIVDDGSSDNYTKEYLKLLNNLEEKKSNIKVKYHKLEKNMGIGYALNKGVELCDNELIYRMDADDIMSPTRLKQQYDFMLNNPHYKLCGGDVRFFETKDGKIKYLEKTNLPEIVTYDFFIEELIRTNNYWHIMHPTYCMKKSAILEIGNYNVNYRQAEDTDLIVRFLKKHGKFYNIKSLPVILLYRMHENQLTKQQTGDDHKIYRERVWKIIKEEN